MLPSAALRLLIALVACTTLVAASTTVDEIPLSIGGISYTATFSPTPTYFSIVHNDTEPFAVLFTLVSSSGPTCYLTYSASGPSGSASGSQQLNPTVAWNGSPNGNAMPTGIYHITASTSTNCVVTTAAISEAARQFSDFGTSLQGSLIAQLSANFVVPDPSGIDWATSLQVTSGTCTISSSLRSTSFSASGYYQTVNTTTLPYVLNTVSFIKSGPIGTTSINYFAYQGNCHYNVTLIPQPVVPLAVGQKDQGQLWVGLYAQYRVAAAAFTATFSSVSGECSISASYKSSTGVSAAGAPIKISPGSQPIKWTATVPSVSYWNLSYLVTAGSCTYNIIIDQ